MIVEVKCLWLVCTLIWNNIELDRRFFLIAVGGGVSLFTILQLISTHNKIVIKADPNIKKWNRSDKYWHQTLTPAQYAILRTGATEPRYSSKYIELETQGTYHCVGCDLELFTSEMKYDSKTGWPSFNDHIKGHLETYTDFRSLFPSTAYRCARCEGHHGHLIMDGPLPTGQRWCNNGQVLKFKSA